jgi:dipeptidyl aminopeptidase/acylaminoacyl peptidase
VTFGTELTDYGRGMDSTTLITELLSARTWTAFDVDDAGRVLAGHDELGSVQLVEIAPDGTRTALTDLPGKCSGRYLPGRRQVVVQHDQGGDELVQLSLLDLDPLPERPVGLDALTLLVHDPEHLHDLRDVTPQTLVYSTNRRNGVDMDVVARDLETGAERVLHDAGGYVVGAVLDHAQRDLAVLRLSLQPCSTVLDLLGPGVEGPGSLTDPDDHAHHDLPGWSADDTSLLLASNHDREFAAVQRLDRDGSWDVLVADDAHDLSCWVSPDGSAMVIGTLVDGAMRLAVHGTGGAHRARVDVPALAAVSVRWSPDSGHLVVSGTAPTEPGVIHLVDAGTGAAAPLVSSAAALPPAVRDALTEPSTHRIPTRDGEQIPCFRYAGATPNDDLAGASVLLVHGGPEAASDLIWHPVVQALASSGLTVLVPNVRGSTGYGKRWYSLDDVDLRLESVADLADLHGWLSTQGLDPQRSALWGGSYGGYMVLAGVSMQPDRWAAGVDIVGISSLVTFLERTSGYRRAYREREYGSLEDHRELLTRASPITYLHQIVAPLFVIHGANDPRVPVGEARQITTALQAKGVPCELRVYDDEGHGLVKRVNKIDAYPAAIDFLHRHLAGPRDE